MKIDKTKIREVPEDLIQKSSGTSRLSILNENRSEITYLSIGQLHPYKKQARRIFNQEEIDSLAETIREHGVRQPLTILRVSADPVHFEVISGERRLRAAKIAGLQKIPCIIIDNADKAEEISLIENIQRQDLHPVELADALGALINKIGWGGQTALEKKLGIARSKISELLKLLELPISVRDELLKKNCRGRDNLRKVMSLQTEKEQLDFLSLIQSETPLSVKRKVANSASVLRISLSEEQLRVQKTGLSKLTGTQKKEFKILLMNLLSELS